MHRPRHTRAARALAGATAAAAFAALAGCGAGAPAPTVPQHIALANTAAAATNPITVSPLPGTPDASPHTQISFLGPSGTTVSGVKVVGSRSGSHDGRIEAYSTGTGESFLPAKPFEQGEHVTVSATVRAGGHSSTVRTAFTIAFQPPISQVQFPNPQQNPAEVQHYRSAPQITPSTVRITTPARTGAAPGDLFLAPYKGAGSPGTMIADQSGNLIWYRPVPPNDAATNFRVQQYQGHPVLTWWEGRILQLGFGQGEDEIYDTSYEPVAHVSAGNGYRADLHEFLLTGQGTAWIDAFDPVDVDLAPMGGSVHGVVSDGIVEEIDVKTGLVMWEWHALGHVPLRDSYNPMPHTSHPWDYFHVNSIDPASNGTILIGSRATWAIYDVDMHSGGFVWRIGGRYSSFRHGPGTYFYWQHDAEWQPGGLVSVFDNGATPAHEKQSRGLVLDPSTTSHTVTLVKQFTNPAKTLLAGSQGNLLHLPDGNWLMGYGGLPNFTEYDDSGNVLLDGTLGYGVQDFRTYLSPWSGQPKTDPSIAAQRAGAGTVTVEASWNGATSVSSWRVLAGSASSFSSVGSAAKTGFETTITVHTTQPEVAVAALSASGATLAISHPIAPS
jgi:Arylsulfotransferase (ASST)